MLMRDKQRAMERTMRQFTQKLTHADVALFYFAGHAVQSGGQNYLLPTDARLRSEGDIARPLADRHRLDHFQCARIDHVNRIP